MGGDGGTDGSEREGDRGDDRTDEEPLDTVADDVPADPADAEDDPFVRLDAGPDREGDPFARLGDDQPSEDPPPIGSGDGEGGPAAQEPGKEGTTGPQDASGPVTGGNPFADIEGASAGREGDPFDGESAFAGVDGEDADGVWERMDDTDDEVTAVPGRHYVEVSKHSYCERCEHFSPPPNVGCTHDGTEILEFTDMETVRVIDCPVVEEREALEDDA